MAFVEKRGVNLQTRFLGYSRREINNLGDFVQTLQVFIVTCNLLFIFGLFNVNLYRVLGNRGSVTEKYLC